MTPTPISKRTRLLWVLAGSTLILATAVVEAIVSKGGGSPAEMALRRDLIIFLGTAISAAWMSRLIARRRLVFIASMALFGAIPLLGLLLFPGVEFWREFGEGQSWLYPWFPVYIASVGGPGTKCSWRSAGVTALLIAGPLITGAVLLLSAALP
jgi:hypothetical protein